jgi:hypothetical protein
MSPPAFTRKASTPCSRRTAAAASTIVPLAMPPRSRLEPGSRRTADRGGGDEPDPVDSDERPGGRELLVGGERRPLPPQPHEGADGHVEGARGRPSEDQGPADQLEGVRRDADAGAGAGVHARDLAVRLPRAPAGLELDHPLVGRLGGRGQGLLVLPEERERDRRAHDAVALADEAESSVRRLLDAFRGEPGFSEAEPVPEPGPLRVAPGRDEGEDRQDEEEQREDRVDRAHGVKVPVSASPDERFSRRDPEDCMGEPCTNRYASEPSPT